MTDLIEAIARLRGPLRVEAFDHIEAGKPDFMAMIVRDPEPGVSEILAQQMQDQTAEDLSFVVNHAADEIAALRERIAALSLALASARCYVDEAVAANGGISACEIHMRHDLENIDAILATPKDDSPSAILPHS